MGMNVFTFIQIYCRLQFRFFHGIDSKKSKGVDDPSWFSHIQWFQTLALAFNYNTYLS